jgi:hypothetical protein
MYIFQMLIVNGWGFRRISSGPDYNSYYHELFLRGIPHLSHRMKRISTKETKKNEPANSDGEQSVPDFYAISSEHPVPHIPGVTSNQRPKSMLLDIDRYNQNVLLPPASSANVHEDLNVLEQRRRELLLHIAALQGVAAVSNPAQASNSFAIPAPPTYQPDANTNTALFALLNHLGITTMPGNQVSSQPSQMDIQMPLNFPMSFQAQAATATNPQASPSQRPPHANGPNMALQQLLALQQQLLQGQQQSGTTAATSGINVSDLLSWKPPAAPTPPIPAATSINLSQLNGVNLQAILDSRNPVAALQQLFGANGHTSNPQQTGNNSGDGKAVASTSMYSPSRPTGETITNTIKSPSPPTQSPLQTAADTLQQQLLQVASGHGSLNLETLEALKKQLGLSSTAPPNNNASSLQAADTQMANDLQRQLGLLTSTAQQQKQGPSQVDLLTQVQRQLAGGNSSGASLQQQLQGAQQAVNNISSSQRGSSSNVPASATVDLQRLLGSSSVSSATNPYDLLAKLLGSAGKQ